MMDVILIPDILKYAIISNMFLYFNFGVFILLCLSYRWGLFSITRPEVLNGIWQIITAICFSLCIFVGIMHLPISSLEWTMLLSLGELMIFAHGYFILGIWSSRPKNIERKHLKGAIFLLPRLNGFPNPNHQACRLHPMVCQSTAPTAVFLSRTFH